ncbi:uncharacterized protein LOC135808534 isoform X3 [Sycon ciliatum]|uniref:uncharacterized protein LOC135808534 isoform X3 n=1 Tax=Sycon ciliatum TaxID=27933 RepID=UPI0031F69FC3
MLEVWRLSSILLLALLVVTCLSTTPPHSVSTQPAVATASHPTSAIRTTLFMPGTAASTSVPTTTAPRTTLPANPTTEDLGESNFASQPSSAVRTTSLLPKTSELLTVPTSAVPTNAPTTAASTNAPATAVPTKAPTTAVPTKAPTSAVPTNAPTTAASTKVPATAALTKVPATAASTKVPATAASTNAPATAVPTKAPTTAVPTKAPTSAVPTNAPTTAASTKVPATAASTNVPATAASTNVPATAASTNVPATAASTNVPATAASTNVPATAASTNVPTTTVPVSATTEDLGEANFASQPTSAIRPTLFMPGTAALTRVPTTAAPTTAPRTNLPANATTEDLEEASSGSQPSSAIIATSLIPKTSELLTVPASTASITAPTTAAPTNVPATAAMTNVPATAATTNVPATAVPTSVPTAATPTSVPTAAPPTNVPTTTPPTSVPAAATPPTTPRTTLPVSATTEDLGEANFSSSTSAITLPVVSKASALPTVPTSVSATTDSLGESSISECGHPQFSYPNTTNTLFHAVIRTSNKTGGKFHINSTVTYYCSPGYNLIGPGNLTCNSNGTWTPAIPPTCSAINCSALGPIDLPNGSFNQTNITGLNRYDHEINFYCNIGYEVNGSSVTKCNATGNWSSPIPKCSIVDCGMPSTGNNSILTGVSSTLFNSTGSFACMIGFNISQGDTQRTCLPTGDWSGSPLHCDVISCGHPGYLPNGTVSGELSFVFNTTVSYSCNRGFNMTGPSQITCAASGIWEPVEKQNCYIITCPTLSTTGEVRSNTSYSPDLGELTVDHEEQFSCSPGYILLGANATTCQVSGQWSNPVPKCQTLDCGEPLSTNHTTVVQKSTTTYNSSVMYQCDTGFDQSTGDYQRTCLETGEWSGSALECSVISCGHPGHLPNGTVSGDLSFVFNATVSYSCNRGFNMTGPSQVTCAASGIWEPVEEQNCYIITCPTLSTTGEVRSNTSYSPDLGELTVDHEEQFSCSPGYILLGANATTCQVSGQWSNPVPKCQTLDCGEPLSTNHSTVVQKSSTTYNSSVMYQCDTGFNQSTGDYQRTCLETGEWSGSTLQCSVISCGHPGHLPNGTVSGDLSFVFNTTVSYSCNRSFTMTGPSQITCGETGIWEPVEEQNCYIITCPTLSTTGEVRSNTSYSPVTGQLTVDHEEQFSCSPGYILLGANVTTCQVSGQWSNPVPKCQILDCGEPLSTNHSTVIQKSNTTYNSSVMYQCDTGFNQSTGDYQRTCLETGEWSGSALQCSVISCGHPGHLPNGTVSGDLSFVFNTTVSYSCNRGFNMTGPSQITCEATGIWEPVEDQNCYIITCPTLNTTGEVRSETSYSPVTGQLTVDHEEQFSCSPGYILLGANVTTCQVSGLWSNPVPECQILDCGEPLSTNHTTVVQKSNTTYNSSVMYQCDTGFNQSTGDYQRTCLETGEWSGAALQCSVVSCGRPQALDNGTVTGNTSYLFNTSISHRCNTGFNLTGPVARTCLANGSWAPSERAICALIKCNPIYLDEPRNGYNQPLSTPWTGNFTVGHTLKFFCHEGYNLSGADTSTCQGDSRWSNPVPTCNIVNCGEPPAVAGKNSTLYSPASTDYGSIANYSCYPGFNQTSGRRQVTCLASGHWNGSALSCQIVSCGIPGNPANGGVIGNPSFTFNTTVDYECQAGFKLTGPTTRSCLANGDWAPKEEPKCSLITCDPAQAGKPSNGHVSPAVGRFTVGDKLQFTCNTGYTLQGAGQTTCQSSSQWSDTAPTCTIVNCGSPPSHHTSSVLAPSTVYRSTASYTCLPGFQPSSGLNQLTCQPSGRWNGGALVCSRIRCSALPHLSNGIIQQGLTSQFASGNRFNFTCNTGYNLIGFNSTVCQDNGQWSNPPPTCNIVDCAQPPDGNNTFSNVSTTVYESEVNYTCQSGFQAVVGDFQHTCSETGEWNGTLPECADIDECNETASQLHDCHDVAVCNNTIGDFLCSCPLGFTGNGTHCKDIDECSSADHTCNAESQVCSNTAGSFLCNCSANHPHREGDGDECNDFLTYVGEVRVELTDVSNATTLALDLRESLEEETAVANVSVSDETLRNSTLLGRPITLLSFELHVVTIHMDHNCDNASLYQQLVENAMATRPSLSKFSPTASVWCKDMCAAESIADYQWPATPAGESALLSCPQGDMNATRQCNTTHSGARWQRPVTINCPGNEVTLLLLELLNDIENLLTSGTGVVNAASILNNRSRDAEEGLSADALDLVAQTLDAIVNNKSLELLGQNLDLTEQLLQNVVSVISNYINASEAAVFEAQKNDQASSRVLRAMDRVELQLAKTMLAKNDTVTPFTSPSFTVKAYYRNASQASNIVKILIESTAGNQSICTESCSTDTEATIGELEVPQKAIPTDEHTTPTVAIVRTFANAKLFAGYDFGDLNEQPSTNAEGLIAASEDSVVNSFVLAYSLYPENSIGLHKLASNITLKFRPLSNLDNTSHLCSFWDQSGAEGYGLWSQEGCYPVAREAGKEDGLFECQCDHLTNFAMLMNPFSDKISGTSGQALRYITLVGGILSCIALLLTAVYPLILRSFTKSRILLSALAGTMFFGNVMFLMSVEDYARNTDGFCTFLGLAVHYLFLSSFLWMLTHALNVYIAVAKPIVYRTIKWVFVKAALFAWGIPFLETLVIGTAYPCSFKWAFVANSTETLCVDTSSNLAAGHYRGCILKPGLPFQLGFVMPIVIIIVVNTVLLTVTMLKLRIHEMGTRRRLSKPKDNDRKRARNLLRCRTILCLTFLLGATWLVGVFVVSGEESPNEAAMYIFTILNVVQGMAIFVFQVMLRKKVRAELRDFASSTANKWQKTKSTVLSRDGHNRASSASTGFSESSTNRSFRFAHFLTSQSKDRTSNSEKQEEYDLRDIVEPELGSLRKKHKLHAHPMADSPLTQRVRHESQYNAATDTIPRGYPTTSEYNAATDTIPRGYSTAYDNDDFTLKTTQSTADESGPPILTAQCKSGGDGEDLDGGNLAMFNAAALEGTGDKDSACSIQQGSLKADSSVLENTSASAQVDDDIPPGNNVRRSRRASTEEVTVTVIADVENSVATPDPVEATASMSLPASEAADHDDLIHNTGDQSPRHSSDAGQLPADQSSAVPEQPAEMIEQPMITTQPISVCSAVTQSLVATELEDTEVTEFQSRKQRHVKEETVPVQDQSSYSEALTSMEIDGHNESATENPYARPNEPSETLSSSASMPSTRPASTVEATYAKPDCLSDQQPDAGSTDSSPEPPSIRQTNPYEELPCSKPSDTCVPDDERPYARPSDPNDERPYARPTEPSQPTSNVEDPTYANPNYAKPTYAKPTDPTSEATESPYAVPSDLNRDSKPPCSSPAEPSLDPVYAKPSDVTQVSELPTSGASSDPDYDKPDIRTAQESGGAGHGSGSHRCSTPASPTESGAGMPPDRGGSAYAHVSEDTDDGHYAEAGPREQRSLTLPYGEPAEQLAGVQHDYAQPSPRQQGHHTLPRQHNTDGHTSAQGQLTKFSTIAGHNTPAGVSPAVIDTEDIYSQPIPRQERAKTLGSGATVSTLHSHSSAANTGGQLPSSVNPTEPHPDQLYSAPIPKSLRKAVSEGPSTSNKKEGPLQTSAAIAEEALPAGSALQTSSLYAEPIAKKNRHLSARFNPSPVGSRSLGSALLPGAVDEDSSVLASSSTSQVDRFDVNGSAYTRPTVKKDRMSARCESSPAIKQQQDPGNLDAAHFDVNGSVYTRPTLKEDRTSAKCKSSPAIKHQQDPGNLDAAHFDVNGSVYMRPTLKEDRVSTKYESNPAAKHQQNPGNMDPATGSIADSVEHVEINSTLYAVPTLKRNQTPGQEHSTSSDESAQEGTTSTSPRDDGESKRESLMDLY